MAFPRVVPLATAVVLLDNRATRGLLLLYSLVKKHMPVAIFGPYHLLNFNGKLAAEATTKTVLEYTKCSMLHVRS